MQSLCIKVVTDIADVVVVILTVAAKIMTKTTIIAAVANVSKKELVIEGSVDEAALKTAIEEAGFEFGGEA